MDMIRMFSRRSLFWIFLVLGLVSFMVAAVVYWGLKFAELWMTALKDSGAASDAGLTIEEISRILGMVEACYLPVIGGGYLMAALILWMCIRISLSRAAVPDAAPGLRKPESSKEITKSVEFVRDGDMDRRLFLHLLSAFQRDGRFLDFLSEDLTAYDDGQIGAAVRTVHENCKKTLGKYLKITSVLDAEEDEEITLSSDFDPNTVKLTGNVTGQPPFRGIVRHKGWRSQTVEIPVLSGARDSGVIAPAEVEIS